MQLRLAKVDELQFLRCIKDKYWGANRAQFSDWEIGDYLVFIINNSLSAFAVISGAPFVSKQRFSHKGAYPYRIPIQFVHIIFPENREPMSKELKQEINDIWEQGFEWGVENQLLLKDDPAENIIKNIRYKVNDLVKYEDELDMLIDAAKLKASMDMDIIDIPPVEASTPEPSPFKKADKPEIKELKAAEPEIKEPKAAEPEIKEPKIEEPAKEIKDMPIKQEPPQKENQSPPPAPKPDNDAKIIAGLIHLGNITGSTVFAGLRTAEMKLDDNGLKGKYLKELPDLGVDNDVANCLKSFDVVWLENNAPLCAFSVKTSGSPGNALLSISDMFAVNIDMDLQLFIVAPKVWEAKIIAQLSRPTFKKIGISSICKFISIEALNPLLSKVKGLDGYIKSNIIDTVATGLKKDKNNKNGIDVK